MGPLRRSAALLLAGTLLPGICLAGEPSVTVRLDPRRLGVRDVTRLEIQVAGGSVEGGAPRPAKLENLQVVGGPSTAQEFSWVNGVSSSRVTYTYILQPLAVGPARVGPITVRVGGRVFRSRPITATVVPGSVARRRPRPVMAENPFDELLGGGALRQVRVGLRVVVPKLTVYEGEPLPLTVVLETTAGIDGFEWQRPPTFPGWWAQRVKLPSEVSPELVTRGGVAYRRYPVARYVLVPLEAGTLEIPSMAARIGLRSFSMFMPSRVIARSTPVTRVRVMPRPPAPEGFSGAVGELRYRGTITPARVRPGGSIMVAIRLEGRGNLPLVGPPAAWPACTTCDAYPPEESSHIAVDAHGIHGSRSWTRALIPRRPGLLRLPAVRLAVFDPARGAYRSALVGPFSVVVEAPPPTPGPTPRPSTAAGGGRAGAETGEAPAPGGERAVGGRAGWAWLVAGLAAGALAGLGLAFWLAGRRRVRIPQPEPGETPADRARRLQGVLEGWWASLPERRRTAARRERVEALRRELERVRFAPGRADHSQTVRDLEERLRGLLRRA